MPVDPYKSHNPATAIPNVQAAIGTSSNIAQARLIVGSSLTDFSMLIALIAFVTEPDGGSTLPGASVATPQELFTTNLESPETTHPSVRCEISESVNVPGTTSIELR